MATGEGVEVSEFSIYELLYQGSESMTFAVENMISGGCVDPFDIIARLEEELGRPIVKQGG